MLTFETPMMTGTRSRIPVMLDDQHVPVDLAGQDVLLNGYKTLDSTESFADGLVHAVMVERGAVSLTIHAAGTQFTAWLLEAAVRHDVGRKVSVKRPTPANITSAVLAEIAGERASQDTRWGVGDHPDGTGSEFRWMEGMDANQPAWMQAAEAKESLEQAVLTSQATYRHILLEEVCEAFAESDPERLRAELIQVAAVAVAHIENIDRRAHG